MSLGDDWIRPEEQYNALDELGRTMNGVPQKDVARGINRLQDWHRKMKKAKEEVVKPMKQAEPETTIDSKALAEDIMSDMER